MVDQLLFVGYEVTFLFLSKESVGFGEREI